MIILGRDWFNKKSNIMYLIRFNNPSRLCLLLSIIILSIISTLFVFSAKNGNISPFLINQIRNIIISIFVFIVSGSLRKDVFIKFSYIMLLSSFLLLLGVKFFGKTSLGAKRWISIANFTFQPSEFFKIAIIFSLANFFERKYQLKMKSIFWSFESFFVMGMVFCGIFLISQQPDFATSVICLGIAVGILFIFIQNTKFVIYTAFLGLGLIPVLWHFFLKDYQKKRILTFLDPELDKLGSGYNAIQSILGIGSGGFWGKGFMNGTQVQLDFLPEKHTDFIFTTIAEEGGFFVCSIIMIIYAFLMFYTFVVSNKSKNVFIKISTFGLGLYIFFHFTINIFMVTGMFPIAGIPLPFISYGGTAMVTSFFAIGYILGSDIREN